MITFTPASRTCEKIVEAIPGTPTMPVPCMYNQGRTASWSRGRCQYAVMAQVLGLGRRRRENGGNGRIMELGKER